MATTESFDQYQQNKKNDTTTGGVGVCSVCGRCRKLAQKDPPLCNTHWRGQQRGSKSLKDKARIKAYYLICNAYQLLEKLDEEILVLMEPLRADFEPVKFHLAADQILKTDEARYQHDLLRKIYPDLDKNNSGDVDQTPNESTPERVDETAIESIQGAVDSVDKNDDWSMYPVDKTKIESTQPADGAVDTNEIESPPEPVDKPESASMPSMDNSQNQSIQSAAGALDKIDDSGSTFNGHETGNEDELDPGDEWE